MITAELKEPLIERRPCLLAQYLMPSRLEQLPEGVEESHLFSAYDSDCVYDERKVELWRRKWRDIPVKERPRTACDILCATLKESYPNIYTALTIFGYDASLSSNSRTISQPAEKIEDLAAKHDDARSVDWSRSLELTTKSG